VAELKTFVEANTHVEVIATRFGKKPGAIFIKCQRLGLKLQSKGYVNVSVSLPRELPSVEEALRMLAGALKTAVKPGLDRVEVQRLNVVVTIAKTYKAILSDYINYRDIESKLKEMEEENARLLKERSPNPAPNQILLKWHSLQQSNSQLKQTITEKTQQLSGDPAEFFEQIIGV
jgi:hypothetical protein